MRRFGLPALTRRPCALAQYHAIAGERQSVAIPMLTPLPGLLGAAYGLAVVQAVAETQRLQLAQAFVHARRPVRPVPDEQADGPALLFIQRLSCHQPGRLAASPLAAIAALHMIIQAPVKLALQHGVERFGQLCRYAWQLPGAGRPVLAEAPVTTADGLLQHAVAVDQRDCDTVDLGLNPQVVAAGDPFAHCGLVQFAQAGLRHWMSELACAPRQRFRQLVECVWKTLMPALQTLACLIVDFVGDQRAALVVVGLVPLRDLLGKCAQLHGRVRLRPVRAGLGQCGQREQ